VSKYFFLRK